MTTEQDDAEFSARAQQMRVRFDELTARFESAYENVPINEGLAEIDAIAEHVRKHA